MVVDRHVNRISSSIVTSGWGGLGHWTDRGGSGRVVVRALEIWIGADLGWVQPQA